MNRHPDTCTRVVQFLATARCQPASRWLVPGGFTGPDSASSVRAGPSGLVMPTR